MVNFTLCTLLTQLRGVTNAGLTLLGSFCGIYDTGVNGCGVRDGLMHMTQYFEIFQHILFLIHIFS
jgi:hypothetical protein